jgi:TonB family protein
MGARTLRRGGWLAAASACLLVMSVTNAAHAQPGGAGVTRPKEEPEPPPPPPPPVITPPELEKDDGAKYPEQAIRDKVKDPVEVVLVVVVDPTGAVKDATVEAPQGHGFDEAAVEAAKKVTYKPATRNGTPIAAKIKHKYTFTPPPSRFVGKVTTRLRDSAIGGATITIGAPDGTVKEVTAGPDGSYRVEGLPAGTYKITVTASGFTPQSFEQAIDPAEEAAIDVRLDREGTAATPPPPPPGVEEVEEVTVRGKRPPREVSKHSLEQRELNRIPGTGGDALRAIQNMPGVARPPAIAGLLIVRGAAPQETGTYVDGTFVPIIYHFGGLSSVIPTEMLEKLDFYPGNFSSYFGRHSGGVIDVGVKDPRVAKDKKIHGLAQVDLIDTRALAEGPIGNTGWNFAVAGRRSWIDTWAKPVLEAGGANVTAAPVYYDYQAILQKSWRGTGDARHNFRLFFFGSDDRFALVGRQVAGSNPGFGGAASFGTAFYRMQARYVATLSDAFELRTVAAVGKDAIDLSLGDIFLLVSSYPISGRVEASHKITTSARNNFGIDMLYIPYTLDARLPPPPRPGEPPPGPFGSRPPLEVSEESSFYRPALYDELELTPFKGTRIVPGVRLDYTKENKSWDVQPRLNARQDLHQAFPRTTVKGGIGRYANPPLPQETNAVFGQPGTRSMIANHYSAGIEQEITKQIEISEVGFYRQYDNVIVQRRGNTGEGRAFGLETLIRYKPDDRFFGFIAYTLSRSVRRDAPQDPEHLFNFDQTHIFTAVGSYRLGRGWEIGARLRVISGSLRNQQTYGFYDATVGAYIPQIAYPPFNERNPTFHQLDVRVDKTWILNQELGHKLSLYLDVWNAYNQGNVEGVGPNYNHTQRSTTTGLPIIPSFGMRIEL